MIKGRDVNDEEKRNSSLDEKDPMKIQRIVRLIPTTKRSGIWRDDEQRKREICREIH